MGFLGFSVGIKHIGNGLVTVGVDEHLNTGLLCRNGAGHQSLATGSGVAGIVGVVVMRGVIRVAQVAGIALDGAVMKVFDATDLTMPLLSLMALEPASASSPMG